MQKSVYTKVYDNHFADELEKARAMYSISLRSDCFCSPEVTSSSSEQNSIDFELFADLHPLKTTVYRFLMGHKDRMALEYLSMAGHILAELHKRLSLLRKGEWMPSGAYCHGFGEKLRPAITIHEQHAPFVVMHCDFGMSNMFLAPEHKGQLIVLDGSFPPYINQSPLVLGSAYYDLAHFVAAVSFLVPPNVFFRSRTSRRLEAALAFIRAYEEVSTVRVDRDTLVRAATGWSWEKLEGERRYSFLRHPLKRIIARQFRCFDLSRP